MATLSRDQLVRVLLARVRLFIVTLDRDAILGPEALAQAGALMAEVPDPSRDPEAAGAIADLHQCRSMLLDGAEAEQAAAIAADLHLAGAVQLAGFRHVIGTLWAIDDTVAADLAGLVYAGLGAPVPDASRAAASVHAAVRAVRDRYQAFPSLWAAHIHVGA